MKETFRFLRRNWLWVLLIILGIITCERYRKEANREFIRNEHLLDSLRYYKLKNGSVVASKQVLEYNDIQMKAMLKQSNENIKELHKQFVRIDAQIQVIAKTRIDSITVRYETPVSVDFKRSGLVKEPHYSFNYESASEGFKIADFELTNDTVTFVKGTKRKWFLGRETNTLDINHSNPYVKDIKLDAMQLKEEKKWHQTTMFKVGIGLVGGILISEQMKK